MKHFTPLPILFAAALIVSACTGPNTTSLEQENQNPLTAARYGDELADTLAVLIIQNDPITKEEGMTARIQKEITRAKNISYEAHERLRTSMMGALLPMGGMDNEGYIAYLDDTLFFSSEFYSDPGPNLHAYLTTVVDPRDVTFPDDTAIDLGEVQSFYGAQQYAVPRQDKPELLRTFVLWDKDLGKLYGFAQLSMRAPN